MNIDRPSSIREAYMRASSFLKEQGVSEAAACTELLLQHVLGWDRTKLLLSWPESFPVERLAEWREMITRKAAGEPVQYIIGEQDFYGLSYAVTPAVLIPRPETELLVEAIVRLGSLRWPGQSPLVADIGTGSGAIAITIAVQCPQWRVWATDLSQAALEVAIKNGRRHVGERIEFLSGDLLAPIVERQAEVDILVSNPPYIPSADMPRLQKEVGQYEPHTALHGGEDGMNYYRRLLSEMDQLPSRPAIAGFEVGQGQAEAVEEMLKRQGKWAYTEIIYDLAGIGRHVLAWRS
ncbi:peptide chain release factor N(5)-glutamine methyltransferase [Paenibacillus sp. J2TS4]|uniref:peptide chain release factor N(5)-glutamine methyltransferase n=1 Tax=Paenibacillus sp. J2TS4 TaxID=2807194 RepID=UPI001B2E200C|nr:peptide chain release factor N(5)-glutamine methyltransferase [Paenibacillus sp. J2TS4]GIP35534.1 release factor glutamine methyltransferase [Paenibacillus sp. J2TS4]